MEGGMNLVEMWGQMGYIAKGIAVILVFMSMWSFGVAIERCTRSRRHANSPSSTHRRSRSISRTAA